jgi:peptidylprolyl isomerase
MKTKLLMTSILAVAAVAAPACAKKPADEAKGDLAKETVAAAPEAAKGADIAADNAAKAEKFLAENGKKEGVKTTSSGLQYQVLNEGPADGYSPKAEDMVVVHYVGTHLDGLEFDSSVKRGAAAKFPLNGVIPGWTEGVQLMSEGDKYRFFIPADLAYGEQGSQGAIGPNEALIFDVELVRVSTPERNLAAAEKFLADNAKKAGVKTTKSGLQYEVLAEGPSGGKSPTDANKVSVHYEGRLIDGSVFDSSIARGEPIEFPLARVIPGWTEGVQLMSEGDKFRFYIPPALAYGEQGTPGGPIGPNEALVFDVELLKVVD